MPLSSPEVFLGQDPLDHVALTALLTCLLEVAALIIPLLLQMTFQPLVAFSQECVISSNLLNKVCDSPVSFLFISQRPLDLFLCDFCLNVCMKSCPASCEVPPHPLLSHELNHPAHDLPLPLLVSLKGEMTVTGQPALQ